MTEENSQYSSAALSAEQFEQIFRTYSRELYWVAMAYVDNSPVAEDIVQEAFMYLWNRKKALAEEENTRAYLVRIVKNHALNHLRHEKITKRHESSIVEEQLFAAENDADDDTNEKIASAKRLIESLPEACRHIFVLCVVEGMSYKEAAQSTRLSVNTIKSQMKIAYQKLRKETTSTKHLRFFMTFFC